MSQDQIKAAKDWIADCVWGDIDEDDITELTDEQVQHGIARHYDGGIPSFINDCCEV